MSANLGPQASTKGEATSKTATKIGYDRLDINKLYKQGKTTEPVAKTVTQKHGMQTLGKAPPARRAGASVVKPEPTPNDTTNTSPVPLPSTSPSLGEQTSQPPKWTNATSGPPAGPPPMKAPVVPPMSGPLQEKNWNGPDLAASYQASRFAQEFPSLDAGSDPPRGSSTSASQPLPPSGAQNSSKSQDNQYGPGPILRPQTEGSWIQGGGRGGPRPPGPYPQLPNSGPNLGGPTPPPMSLGPGGPAPPPLGAYPMQYRGMAPFMHPNGPPPPGPGYYPSGSVPRYGMPVPPGAPQSRDHPFDSHREGRGRAPPSNLAAMRPTQQFTVKPIIREEDLKRMDEIDQDGSWATVREEIDYNKKILFSDDEDDKREDRRKPDRGKEDDHRSARDMKPIRILERQHSSNERDKEFKHRDKFDGTSKEQTKTNQDKERGSQLDSSKGRNAGRVRDLKDDEWRGNRFDDEQRKKGAVPRVENSRSGEFPAKQFSNLPPRLLRQQQQHPQSYSASRRSPSPTGAGGDREWESDKRATTQYRILERSRGDSESSGSSIRDKRGNTDFGPRGVDKEVSRIKREKDQKAESLKDNKEGLDIREEQPRTHKFSTSSWADQVDDEDAYKQYGDYSEVLNKVPDVPEFTKEERTVPKRVYIQQRKVENMATSKMEVELESTKPLSQQSRFENDKNRSPVVWGERDEKVSSDGNRSDKDDTGEDNRLRTYGGSEREIILSDKAKQLPHNRDREDMINRSDRISQERDQKDHTERNRKDVERNRDRQFNQEYDRGDKSWGSRSRTQGGRWGGSDYKGDNKSKTPDRDMPSGRSSTSDQSSSGKLIMEGDRAQLGRGIEPQKQGEKGMESTGTRESFPKQKEMEKADSDGKTGKQRERIGHVPYQPRGGWSRQDNRGKSRGGRDYNDRSSRRNEYSREDRSQRDESEKECREGPDVAASSAAGDEKPSKDMSSGDTGKKSPKSPIASKRNVRGGGRIHGYGPPADKPFSSGVDKEDDGSKSKPAQGGSKASSAPVGPVPLMELGDISPPSMVSGRGRHTGGRGARGGGVIPRQEGYSPRGGSKRGGRDGGAKPLMSLNSNEVEKQEAGTESDSHDDDSRRGSKKKENVRGSYRPNQNEQRHQLKEKGNLDTDVSNNNKGKFGKDDYQSHPDSFGCGSASDHSENVDSDVQGKKSSKDKTGFVNRNSRYEKQSQSHGPSKDGRRGKATTPFETHARPSMPPRFQKTSNFSNSKTSELSSEGKETESEMTWEPGTGKSDAIQPHKVSPQSEVRDGSAEGKVTSASSAFQTAATVTIDGTTGPLKTMIFENRNFRNASKVSEQGKVAEARDNSNHGSTGLELTKDIGLSFGKNSGESHDIDFGSNFENTSTSQPSQNVSSYASSKPMPIGQTRSFQSHHPSPVSPLAKDLTEKIQSVRQVWEKPAMPSVTEQAVTASEDSNTFHSGFAIGDSFKSDSSRDFNLQSQSSYVPSTGSTSIAPISKPDNTIPSSTSARHVKPAAPQASMENHVGMSSSPFTYSMPQQATSFGGPPSVPSPPTALVYGSSQPLTGHTTGVYQAFSHIDSSQVMNTGARSQYGQFSTAQGTGAQYNLGTSIFLTSMDTGYQQMSSYQPPQHQQATQVGHGHGPSQTTRSPGPISTSGTTAGVVSSMKSQASTTGHPNMSHQVIATPAQQGYSQMGHHHGHAGTIPHHQLPPVGHVAAKPNAQGYGQGGMTAQSQLYIPYEQVLNPYGGQSFVSSGIRNAAPGPPPSATPPMQGMQGSSNYYSGNASNQVYPGSNQGGGLQQLHVAVAPNHQLQNLQTATQQYGQQFQIPGFSQLQGFSQQAATTVSALNLAGQLIRPPNTHSHYGMKQGMEMMQQAHGMKSHEPMMNPTWSAQGFPLNQTFHGGNKSGGNSDRGMGGNFSGGQRKGGHQMTSMSNMGGPKYIPNSGYSSQQKGGRYNAPPGPIQRPNTTPASGPMLGSGQGMRISDGMKPHDTLDKSLNQPGSASVEEGFLDKLMTEGQNRSIAVTSVTESKLMMSGSGFREDNMSSKNGGDSSVTNSNLTMSPANKSPIGTSE